MRRGTTPIHKFTVDMDLDGLVAVYITYEQNGQVVLEKTIDDVQIDAEQKTITVNLSQADTLLFSEGKWERPFVNTKTDNIVKIQMRLKFSNGSALASNVIVQSVDEILKEGEI